MDDERAAIEEPVQWLEEHGKGLPGLDFLSAQTVQVPGAWVLARIDDGVKLLADIAVGVEGERINGEQPAGGGVDAGGLDGQRYVGEGGEGFLAGGGPVLVVVLVLLGRLMFFGGLLLGSVVRTWSRLRGAGVR